MENIDGDTTEPQPKAAGDGGRQRQLAVGECGDTRRLMRRGTEPVGRMSALLACSSAHREAVEVIERGGEWRNGGKTPKLSPSRGVASKRAGAAAAG